MKVTQELLDKIYESVPEKNEQLMTELHDFLSKFESVEELEAYFKRQANDQHS